MYTIIISLAVALITGASTRPFLGPGWSIFLAILAFMIVQLIIGLVIRKKVNKLTHDIQNIMQEAQLKINRQMQLYQSRQPNNLRQAQQNLEKMQLEAVRKTLDATEQFTPLYRWNFLIKKQVNTMKLQLHYQLKEFAKVDELLPKSMLIDARSLVIKLVRLYKNNDPSLDKFYNKKCRMLKEDDCALFALTYAWIKLQKSETEKAIAALNEAKKRTDNETLVENCSRLLNGKEKLFNNAGLGDQWYSLYLEEPKYKQIRQRPDKFPGHFHR